MEKLSVFRFILLMGLVFNVNFLLAQNSINGTIVDTEDGAAIPGASVFILGTTNGTATDFDGNFTINVPSDGTLSVSFIGYITQNISISGQTILKVTLEENISALDGGIIYLSRASS